MSFAAERPGLAPGKARLPEPARKMTRRDAAIVRGHADSIALKLACHDPKVHRKLMPGNPQARGVFEAVEQARVEAIGARRMSGVAKNLTAMLDDHFHRGKYRRDHRPRRRAAVGCAGDAGARAPDRHGAARGREEDGRPVAADPGGQDRLAARPACPRHRGSGQVRRHGARPVVGARSRRRPQRRVRRGRRTTTTIRTATTISPARKARPTATPRRR